jgi:hypothetical protein
MKMGTYPVSKNVVFSNYLEFQMMDMVQIPSDSEDCKDLYIPGCKYMQV